MVKLSEPEIQQRMPAAKGWDRLGDMLVRTWQFSSSRRALEFVNQAVAVSERLGLDRTDFSIYRLNDRKPFVIVGP